MSSTRSVPEDLAELIRQCDEGESKRVPDAGLTSPFRPLLAVDLCAGPSLEF